MLILTYNPNSNDLLVPDGKLLFVAKKLYEDYSEITWRIELVTGCEALINAFRTLIAEGAIDNEKVGFHFNGKTFFADVNGRIADWPDGFCDTVQCLCERILMSQVKNRKTLVAQTLQDKKV